MSQFPTESTSQFPVHGSMIDLRVRENTSSAAHRAREAGEGHQFGKAYLFQRHIDAGLSADGM